MLFVMVYVYKKYDNLFENIKDWVQSKEEMPKYSHNNNNYKKSSIFTLEIGNQNFFLFFSLKWVYWEVLLSLLLSWSDSP